MFYINGEKKTVAQVIDTYGLLLPKKKRGSFRLHGRIVQPDPLNGGLRHPVTIQFPAVFTGTDIDGNGVEIRYAKSSPKKGKSGDQQWNPRKMEFDGVTVDFDLNTQKEEWVYFFLYPYNMDSPFHAPSSEALWEVEDKVKIAEEVTYYDRLEFEAKKMIYDNPDIGKLRQIAKGMGQNDVDEWDSSEVLAFLQQRATENPKVFLDEIQKNNLQWQGVLKDAIDKGYIKSITINHITRWLYDKGDLKGKEITLVPADEDPMEALKDHILDNFEVEYRRIYNMLNAKKRTTGLSDKIKSVEKVEAPDKLRILIEEDFIHWDRQLMKVFWVEKGDIGAEIGAVKNAKSWFNEIVAIIEDNKELSKKLDYKYRWAFGQKKKEETK